MALSDTTEYHDFMHALADKADDIARHYFRQPDLSVENKADNSPVTLADQEIEMAIIEQIRRHYPDHGIYGEESARINPDAAYQWVIDPIDGTRAFIAGKPTFTTLIALCHESRPLLGLISQAIKQQRWLANAAYSCHPAEQTHGVGDCGVRSETLTSQQVQGDNMGARGLSEAMISTTSLPYFSADQTIAFQRLEKATRSTLLNHDGLAYGMLADGDLDIVLDAKLKPYDFCALVPVVQQAGAIITDWNGREVTMQSDGTILAAANKMLHKQALELINSR